MPKLKRYALVVIEPKHDLGPAALIVVPPFPSDLGLGKGVQNAGLFHLFDRVARANCKGLLFGHTNLRSIYRTYAERAGAANGR